MLNASTYLYAVLYQPTTVADCIASLPDASLQEPCVYETRIAARSLGEAADAVRGYVGYLEAELAPRARASFRLGREKFERKLQLEEGLSIGVDAMRAMLRRRRRTTRAGCPGWPRRSPRSASA